MNYNNKRIVFLSLVCFFVLFPCIVKAQTGLLSPYSTFGVGAQQPYLNTRNMSLGGIGIGLAGKNSITPFNPATYMLGVDTLSVMFDIGFNFTMNKLDQNLSDGSYITNQSATANLSNLEFYFPLFKWWKMGIYLLPVTDVAYLTSDFRTSGGVNIGETQLIHQGSGGLSKFGWGNAFGWGPISVGINLNYQFGQIEELNILKFVDTNTITAQTSRYLTISKLQGLVIDVGVLYSQPIKEGSHINIGASYTIKSNLSAKRYSLATSVAGTSLNGDTAYFSPRQIGKVTVPSTLRVGLSYDVHRQWLIGMDFSYVWWKEYRDFGKEIDFFRNTYSIALGAELKSNMQSTSIMRRIAYRIGGRYETFYADFGGKNLDGFAISLGIGIPVRKTRSFINIGLEYGKTGSLDKSQIRENYFRVGLSFTSVETWFVKRRYD